MLEGDGERGGYLQSVEAHHAAEGRARKAQKDNLMNEELIQIADEMRKSLNTPEPPPSKADGPAVWDLVIADIQERDVTGTAKYGQRLTVGDGRRSLVDLYQELLDAVVYTRKEIAEEEILSAELVHLRSEVARLRALAVPQLNGGEALRCIHRLANEAVKVIDEGEYPERSAIAEIRAIAGSEYPKLEAESGGDDYVAWLRFRHREDNQQPYLSICDSDEEGSFKVYRRQSALAVPESAATEHPDTARLDKLIEFVNWSEAWEIEGLFDDLPGNSDSMLAEVRAALDAMAAAPQQTEEPKK